MTEPNDDWTEFDWELALRESDQFAARYFSLLRRFCDLPGGNELIAQHMGPEFEGKLPECDYDCENCDNRWECDFTAQSEWHDNAPPEEAQDDDDDVPEGLDEDDEPDSEEPIYYETDPTFTGLRQAAIGWCNIYSAILPPEARPEGVRILFHIGRALANLAYSIDDGLYNQPAASVAFAKRAVAQLNHAIGLINQLIADKARLKRILQTIRDHLMQSHEALLDHLQRCHEQRGKETK